jgi:lipoprotein-anchoring transpeptidase ErfK/SrfK
VRVAKKRKWNISRAASFQSHRGGAPQPWEEAGEFDGSHTCLVLRRGVAVAVAFLASSLSGTIAVAQQIAVNVEGQAAQEASPDEEQPDDAYARQIVPFHTSEAPGTIIIDTGQRYLYLVQPNDRAIRYGIGVGRIGFQWSGVERVSQKQEWPDWRAPPEMVGRQPYLPRFMAGGPGNPLGARALYLGHSSSASTEPTSRRRSGTPFRRDAFASTTPT